MSWNGHLVVDMDAHIRERADKFFKDYIDPEYCASFSLLCEAIALQEKKGDRYALFGQTTAIIEKIEAGRALGVRASDWPHGDTAWPEAVPQTVERARLGESARRKILGENALRLCPRLRG